MAAASVEKDHSGRYLLTSLIFRPNKKQIKFSYLL